MNKPINEHEARNRARRANALIATSDVIARESRIDPYKQAATVLRTLERYTEEEWRKLGVCAGVRNPDKISELTRALVKDEYRGRAARIAKAISEYNFLALDRGCLPE